VKHNRKGRSMNRTLHLLDTAYQKKEGAQDLSSRERETVKSHGPDHGQGGGGGFCLVGGVNFRFFSRPRFLGRLSSG